ncbi:MAG: AraC family transcriptional regulator [Oscillospiraceae bacterium]|nr:AraC family transcriptional regulator [Oscillospiraceae bacterium]
MNSLADGIQNAIRYIEANLTEELDISLIAAEACVSAFHFQRMFSILTGMTVGEYIRCRRLSAAAQELSLSGTRVLDIALKYGYESQDSFSRAFTRFHGISPAAAKETGARLKSFAPMRLRLILEGGYIMDYRIVEKAAFTVIGKAAKVPYEKSYDEIPKLWEQHLGGTDAETIRGMFGICTDADDENLEYLIADVYFPQRDIPEDCTVRTFPAGTWAVFPCKGPAKETIQRIDKQIFSDWLPNNTEYKLAASCCSVEAYITPPSPETGESYNEIWLPVEKI